MLHSCGQSHFQLKQNRFSINIHDYKLEEHNSNQSIISTKKQLYTAYLGSITTEVSEDGNFISLEKYHLVNDKQILVKVVDAVENNISDQKEYTLNYLKNLPAKKINIQDNKYSYFLTQLCNKKFAQLNHNLELVKKLQTLIDSLITDNILMSKASSEYPELLSETPTKSIIDYKKIFKKVVLINDPVDIFFNTTNYLDFLFSTTKLTSVANLDCLISVCNVPNLDNAFFTGEYMVFGSGDTMFYPLSSIDVVGHELSHGLVSGTAGLEYKGHSGALNESFADIMGTMFEFYMYEKYPHLEGKSDWTIGEDLVINTPFLRSMQNPIDGKQPNKYKGQFYINPNIQMDNGGVHINSGITNYCFYLASQQKDKYQVLSMFLQCLCSLKHNSNFVDFRDTLKSVSNSDPILLNALITVGLDDKMISDYPQQQLPIPRPLPLPQQIPMPIPMPIPIPRPLPQQMPMPRPLPQQIPIPSPRPLPRQLPIPRPRYCADDIQDI